MSITPAGDYQPETPETPEPAPKRSKPWIAIVVATAAVICIGGLGTATVAELTAGNTSTTSSTATTPNTNTYGSFGNAPGGGAGNGNRFGGGLQGGQSIGQQATAGEATATAATAAQKVGIVTINTVLDYNTQEQAAGTGMILTSNGYILTNNHVVEGSTSITVTVESTGQKYTATVVGTDKTADVAVLKLTGASGLSTVSFASTEKVSVGESIYSVGNAEGTGNLVTAVGTVGATNQSLTVGSDSSDGTENLSRADRAQLRRRLRRLGRPAVRLERQGHRHGHRGIERQRRRHRLRPQHRPGAQGRRPDRGRNGLRATSFSATRHSRESTSPRQPRPQPRACPSHPRSPATRQPTRASRPVTRSPR